jgi:ABC-2 type transport system permease protein
MFRAEILKVRSHRLPWITYGVYAALLTLFALLSTLSGGGESALPLLMATAHLQIGFIFAIVVGAWIGGTDFAAGTWRVILARDDRRVLQLANRVAVLVVVVAVGSVLTFLVGVAAGAVVAVAAGADPVLDGLSGLLWGSMVTEVAYALVAFSVAVLFRSTAAGMSIGLAYALVADTILFGIWPDLKPYLLSTALGQVSSSLAGVGSAAGGIASILSGVSQSISTGRAWFTLVIWLVVLVGGAVVTFQRRDVTG